MAVLGSDWLQQYLKTALSTLFRHILLRKTDISNLVVVKVADLTVQLTEFVLESPSLHVAISLTDGYA
jgi:hypothetical protein